MSLKCSVPCVHLSHFRCTFYNVLCVAAVLLAQMFHNIFINTEQRVVLTMLQNPGPQNSLGSWLKSVSQAFSGLSPGSILLQVDLNAGVCTPGPKRWPRGYCVRGLGKGECMDLGCVACAHKPPRGMGWSRG